MGQREFNLLTARTIVVAGVVLAAGLACAAAAPPRAQTPALVAPAAAAPAAPDAQAAAPVSGSSGAAGRLEVTFLYMPPTTIDPTYHTAMWLEDGDGRLVKTLYVSQELSSAEYKLGTVCPDWVKLAHWDTTPKSEVDAMTAPTPNVGSEAKVFDLAELGVKPGVYQFKFQMHVSDEHNVLFRGSVTVGGPSATPELEMTQGPGTLVTTDQFVREVQLRYAAPQK